MDTPFLPRAGEPVDRHGLVGDLRTTALVGADGRVVNLCLPDADSPSVFAALVDDEAGGCLDLEVAGDDVAAVRRRQHYLPGTNVLISRVQGDGGIVEVVDFMVPQHLTGGLEGVLVRRVRALHGPRRVRVGCWPGFDYARADHRATAHDGDRRVRFDAGAAGALTLVADRPWTRHDAPRGPRAVVEADLAAGETLTVVLHWDGSGEADRAAAGPGDAGGDPAAELVARVDGWFTATVDYWQSWLSGCTYTGPWQDSVHRSALCLKLLQHAPTGGIVAAPTFSLPEWPGTGRTWDYRYVWLRDAAFVMFAMLRIGFVAEARAFAAWLGRRCVDVVDGQGMHPVYRLDGTPPPEEEVLDHLAGHRGSRPVRIGNAAYDQVQLDVLGEVMDAVYLFDRVEPISWDLWQALQVQLAWLADHWEDPDAGIWEVRGPRQQFVSSKVLVWVAFERAVRLTRRRGLPGDRERWQQLSDAAYRWVQEHGWDEEVGAYVQRAGSTDLDASVLLVPMLRFAAGTDPRVVSTMDAVDARLGTDSLIHRYRSDGSGEDAGDAGDAEDAGDAGDAGTTDGLGGREGTFTMTTFWYAENLARAGRVDRARQVFEKTLTYAGELDLFSEQIGPAGEALGNYPQALTHLALISAATTLQRHIEGDPAGG